MTKNYFNPASVWFRNLETGKLSKMPGRAIELKSRHNRGACFRTGGEDPSDATKELLEKVKTRIATEMEERGMSKEKITEMTTLVNGFKDLNPEALREMADEKTGAMAMIQAQGLQLKELKNKISKQPEDLSVRSQVKAWMEANKEAIIKIRSGSKADLTNLDIKLDERAVANPMLPSTVMPGGSLFITKMQVEGGFDAAPLPIPTFFDYIRKGKTNAETYIWVNKLPREGEAAFIAPGVYKPNISFTMSTDISNAKKVAASEKMATELLQDVDGFTDFVEAELKNAVMMKVNEKLTTGVASSTTPAGIRTLSVAYTNVGNGLQVVTPNYWDALKAVEVFFTSQVRFAGRRVTIFANPVDLANAELTKAVSQGQLFKPATLSATVVEDANIPLGYIQAGLLDAYRVLIYKPFSMAWGWENDDFTKNLVTVIGEMRLHQFVKTIDTGAFVYDSFASIITKITKA